MMKLSGLICAFLACMVAVACSAPSGMAYLQDAADSSSSRLNAVQTVQDAVASGPRVAVMGEVNRPGRYPIDRPVFTVFDALGEAGDMTIYGRRDNVKVMRRDPSGTVLTTYVMDLNSTRSVLESPGFVLQDNDIIYVEPNAMRSRQSTVNGNTLLSAPFWISVASLVATVLLYTTRR